MRELAEHIHWWKQALPGVGIILGLALLAIPLWKLFIRQLMAERCWVMGFNSVSDQFKDVEVVCQGGNALAKDNPNKKLWTVYLRYVPSTPIETEDDTF